MNNREYNKKIKYVDRLSNLVDAGVDFDTAIEMSGISKLSTQDLVGLAVKLGERIEKRDKLSR